MTAFDKKVNQIAARHGWNISPVSGWYIPAYSIVPMDRKGARPNHRRAEPVQIVSR